MDQSEATSKTIYITLRDELLGLTIKPGQQISESEVCQRFGVSRTPVRTAFQRLKDAGLLSIVPYKTTSATLLDFEQIQQVIYLRVAVETRVICDLIENIDALTTEKIRHNLKRQEIMLASEFAPEEFYEIDSRLHNIWFSYTRKQSLWKLIQRMQVNYTRFRMLDIVAVQNFDEIYKEHLELFSAIGARNTAAVEPLIERHLYGGVKRLGDRIHTEFSPYFQKPPEEAL